MDFKRNGNLEDTPFIGKIKVPEEKIKQYLITREKEGADPHTTFVDYFGKDICDTVAAINNWVNSQDSGEAQTVALATLFFFASQMEERKDGDGKMLSAKTIATLLELKHCAINEMFKEGPLSFLKDILGGINRGGGGVKSWTIITRR